MYCRVVSSPAGHSLSLCVFLHVTGNSSSSLAYIVLFLKSRLVDGWNHFTVRCRHLSPGGESNVDSSLTKVSGRSGKTSRRRRRSRSSEEESKNHTTK